MKRHLTLLVAFLSFVVFVGIPKPASVLAVSLSSPLCRSGTITVNAPVLTPILSITHVIGDTITVILSKDDPTVDDPTGTNIVGLNHRITHVYSTTGTSPVGVFGNGPTFPEQVSYTISLNGGSCGSGGGEVTSWDFDDGRINSHDGAETAAVYCEDYGGVTIYAVIKSVGYPAFMVTGDELDELPEHPEHDTLIKSGMGIALYELTTGELQINAPDNYVFTWDGCSA